jgi:Helix-turn-helix domain
MPQTAPGTEDDDEAWAIAVHRAEILRRLLDGRSGPLRGDEVAAAASELGISRAGLYRLAGRYKALGVASSLLPARGGRPAGSR